MGVCCGAIANVRQAVGATGSRLFIDVQPLCAQILRLIQALDWLGSPLKPDDRNRLLKVLRDPESGTLPLNLQTVLDPYALLQVTINPESRVSVVQGQARPILVQHGWRVFLVKVLNSGQVTARLNCSSPQVLPDSGQAPGSQITPTGIVPPGSSRPEQSINRADILDRWLAIEMFDKPPLAPELSGLPLEYRIIELYSRDNGRREASIGFDVGVATRDIGFRNNAPILFICDAASSIQLRIRDVDGSPATASLIISDSQGRIYPCRPKRLAPDFPFQDQIYRADGQSILLPPGTYSVISGRGPEYLSNEQRLTVGSASDSDMEIQLRRWIDPVASGWYPGDHHVHAAGCSHYNTPTEGVRPSDMAPQVRGEGLSFADILTWGPCWYHQKEFFRGYIDPVSTARSVLRYDVEISGFPSSYWGHLVLLQLKDQDYPGTNRIEDWPTWNLPILRWAKAQESVTGFAHTGHGLVVASNDLPNLLIPAFDDNGANEFLIDITHGVVDFLSAADTPAPAELNLWYHALNCGFRIPIAGETDFPCLFEKVGVGRSYVYMPHSPLGDAGYREWIAGLKGGRSYVSDGRSHILKLEVNGRTLSDHNHQIELSTPQSITAKALVAAYLPELVTPEAEGMRKKPLDEAPFWHIERCRIGPSRQALVELIVNGRCAGSQKIDATGEPQLIAFETKIQESSWVAIRIFPSCHSNPMYVRVGGKPLRSSRQSAQWCIDCIQAAWSRLGVRIAQHHRAEAIAARNHAVASFHRILDEAVAAGNHQS
jgi:hypothetical protein